MTPHTEETVVSLFTMTGNMVDQTEDTVVSLFTMTGNMVDKTEDAVISLFTMTGNMVYTTLQHLYNVSTNIGKINVIKTDHWRESGVDQIKEVSMYLVSAQLKCFHGSYNTSMFVSNCV